MTVAELLKKIRTGYLFDLDCKVRQDLNLEQVTGDLRTMFSERGHYLSEDAKIHVVKKGRQWKLDDGDKGYVISWEGKDLKVCEPVRLVSQREMADKAGSWRAKIGNVEQGRYPLSVKVAKSLIANHWMTDDQAEELMLAVCREALDGIVAVAERARRKLKKQYMEYPDCLKLIRAEEKKWHITN